MGPGLVRNIAIKKLTKLLPAIPSQKVHFEKVARSVSKITSNLSFMLLETLEVSLLVANTTAHTVNPIMHRNVLFAEVPRGAR
jgi:hypothetical protein